MKTPDVIYAAECTFHNKLYIGHTSQPLNIRFNGHRSDAKIKPTACELVHHFHHNTCDFNKDLRVYILQDNVTGPNIKESFWKIAGSRGSTRGNLMDSTQTLKTLQRHFIIYTTRPSSINILQPSSYPDLYIIISLYSFPFSSPFF